MHDFGPINLKGCTAVFKRQTFYKANATKKARTLTVLDGPGTTPDLGTSRRISVKWADGSTDKISSYDLESVTKDGVEVKPV